jgi:GT2 family glycosyltransferase
VLARVIVLNWNGRRWLDGCLSSLLPQVDAGVEVVLVDNASSDDSVALVRSTFPRVEVRALTANRGFAAGNNAGAAGATSKYLVFLNNDTRVAPGWLHEILAVAEATPAAGLFASRVVYLDRPEIIDSAGDGFLRCGGAFKIGHGRPAAGSPGSREVFGACGAALVIRRDLFESLGGFDEDLFMVYEDVDLSYRARLAGSRVRYVSTAVVEHAGSASLGRLSRAAVFHGQRNLEWVWLKNSPWPLLLRSAPAHLAYDLAAAAGYARQGLFTTWCRAKWAALAGLPAVWRKRRTIHSRAVARPPDLWHLMEPRWVSVKRAEKRFDFTAPP